MRAIYDAARRRWAGSSDTWPRSGSLRGTTATSTAHAVAAGRGSLQSTRMRWPTLLRTDGTGRCARHTNARYKHFSNLVDGYVEPRWAEWLMGLAGGWTGR